jgi:parallel beta-helix repeat protein
MKFRLVIAVILFVCLNFHLFATTYYVSNAGNDADPGTLSKPFLTIQNASNKVAAGDTVFILNGVYAGFDHRFPSGTASDPIVYFAESQATIIDSAGPIRSDGINVEGADYIIVDGFTIRNIAQPGNGIRIVLSNNCIVKNCICDGNWNRGIFTAFTDDILIEHNESMNTIDEHGIYVSNSSDRPIIRYNISHDNNNIGIHMNGDLSAGGDGIISDALVYGNIIYNNNQAAGINMDGVENALVYNNLIYNNHSAQGIALFQIDGAIPSRGARIFHNTIIVPSDGRWGILLVDGANVGTEIINNIIINMHSFRGSITTEDTSGLRSDFNILSDKMSNMGDGTAFPLSDWQLLGLDINSQKSNPLTQIFNDPLNEEFSLFPGSQAINAGTITTISEDINEQLRDLNPDIGAFESNSTLPILLEERLNGYVDQSSIIISWKVQQIINSELMELQKQTVNGIWKPLATFQDSDLHHQLFTVRDLDPRDGMNAFRLIEKLYDQRIIVLDNLNIEFIDESPLAIWPNPTSDLLHIDGDTKLLRTIQVLTLSGMQLYNSSTIQNELLFPNIPAGSYLLILKLKSGKTIKKIVIFN